MPGSEYEGWLGVCDAKDPWASVRLRVGEGLEAVAATCGIGPKASVCPKALVSESCLGTRE